MPISTTLSGGWDLLSMVVRNDTAYADAEGFAFDGRTLDTSLSYLHRTGGQRLAEVLIYNRRLTDTERLNTEAYLSVRWRLGHRHAAPTNSAAVALADGTVLDLSGTNQYVAAVSGAGMVRNGTLETSGIDAGVDGATWRIDFDGDTADLTAVTGTCTFGRTLTVDLKGIATVLDLTKASVKVLSAGQGVIAETGLKSSLSFTGDELPPSLTPTFRVSADGDVFLSFTPHGTLTIFR